MVKRYTLNGDRMFPHESGRWVYGADHDAEVERLTRERDQYAHANREQAKELAERQSTIERLCGLLEKFRAKYRGQIANDGTYPTHLFDALAAREDGNG